MMKRLLRLLLVCVLLWGCTAGTGAKAQPAALPEVVLTWQGLEEVPPTQGSSGKIPTFIGAVMDYSQRLPYYRLHLPGTHLSNFRLANATYAPFTSEEQKLLKNAAIGAEPLISIANATENKLPAALVTILPLRRNPQTQQLEKLVHFSYAYAASSPPARTQAANALHSSPAATSVLSSGDWYKLAVTGSGIYKIDGSTLQALGINTQNLDSKTIQLYGNGGGMLPQPNSTPRPDDLQENTILVSGEADGRFDAGDYVLFYAQGPHTWTYDAAQQQFTHHFNIYSDTAYYFLRIGYAAGKRISSRGQASGAAQQISSYDEHLFHELEQKNMVYSGREWYGEEFSSFTPTREISFPVANLVPGTEVTLTAFLMANSPADCSFTLKLNNQLLGSQSIPNRGTYNYHPEGVNSVQTYTVGQPALGNPTELKAILQFDPGGSSTSLGYLNYLELTYKRQLQLYGEQTTFRSVASMNAPFSTFDIANASASALVWDVTDPLQPVQQQTEGAGSGLRFSAPTSVLREFVVFQNGSGLAPVPIGKVVNQNLHALNLDGTTDLVIVTHPTLLAQANRLAAYRSEHTGLQVEVVTTQQVYNEFSSGAPDITAIRDMMRLVYSRSSNSGAHALYLLLFGDATYDYKNHLGKNTLQVPVYESRESLNPISSYSSEDYYGFLDEEEGEWAETLTGDHLLDIGIGRLPAKNAQEAATMVDKIMAYESPAQFGKWRSRITFVADDGDSNEHLNDAEYLAAYLEENFPNYTPNKVYLDLFPQEGVANGQRSPAAAEALTKAVEQGSLITNYTGHGNEISWTAEQILTIPQLQAWKNSQKLTFLLTATCEFGRYDDPARTSAAELAVLQPDAGAIGLLTTTRPVYATGNRVLNRNFFRAAFTPVEGQLPRLGDLVMRTKNNSITGDVNGAKGVNNRNFTLLCDPSLQLAYPDLQVQITQVNGKQASADTLGALSKVTLAGQVSTADGSIAADFSGTLHLTVYEKPVTRLTLGDESSQSVPVQVRDNVLYDGKATVRNGQFEAAFVVPKDINYSYGYGKVTLYASNDKHDAMGANQSIVIGGTASNSETDNTPPTIQLFLDDESFIPGGTTGSSPVLLAKLYDTNGINTAGIGIGHELTVVLDENKEDPTILNDFYTAAPDSYQQGRITYSLKDLAPGLHSLRLKAWDTYNNAAEEYIEFFVSNDTKLALEHVLNYPNPFSTKTTFYFDHNRAGETLDIQIQIFTISGKLVRTLQTTSYASQAHLAALTWNGRDEYNDVLARGVYVYKVNVRSQQDGSSTSKFEKLVILN
ncbi:type IX secretion system sortase PorU [Pontibacter chitinilyticus]|uniref:type IX secretion system sortase PorU n=1 Tax=Pontibacter chitinilyticus TaxID=2674989 RepID=UPI00321A8074